MIPTDNRDDEILSYLNKYSYRAVWSDEDEEYIGLCTEFPSLSGTGETPEEAIADVRVAVKAAVDWILDDKERPPIPLAAKEYRGKISLRVPPDTHRRLSLLAAEEGVSLNQFITSWLELNSGAAESFSGIERLRMEVQQLREEIRIERLSRNTGYAFRLGELLENAAESGQSTSSSVISRAANTVLFAGIGLSRPDTDEHEPLMLFTNERSSILNEEVTNETD